jgi:hypothetical protein
MNPTTFSALVERVSALTDEISDLHDEIKTLRRGFYTFAFGVVGSAILFSFTVFALLGRHP